MGGRRITMGVLGLLTVAGLIGAACGGGGGGGSDGAGTVEGPQPVARDVVSAGKGTFGGGSTGAPDESAPGGPVAQDARDAVAGVSLAALGQKIVKTASLGLQVKDGSFDQAFQDATIAAGRFGGYVASSQSRQGTHRSGTLVLRVPAAQFEQALGALRAIGTVTSQSVSGQDVTGQLVDLQARLRNWQSQEAVLLRLMAKATSIEDSIAVQQQLQNVQLAVEEIQGQLRVLDDQTSYGTISLSMSEGAIVPAPTEPRQLSFARAWSLAVHGFVAVFAAVLIGLGYLIPLALIGLLLGGVWVLTRRMRTRPATSG